MLVTESRPRNLNWFHAGPLLFGDWGTSRLYVLGLAFYYTGHASPLYMTVMAAVMAAVAWAYTIICRCFPEGGGDAAAAGKAFGDAWGFPPMGALIVDFALTIAISVAAATSAIISYVPDLSGWRVPLAVGLCCVVAGITWFGHLGRVLFAAFTLVFLAVAVVVEARGWISPAAADAVKTAHDAAHPAHAAFVAVILAFPVAMALATGVEAPLTAIAQLGQLDNLGRKLFGRLTLVLTLGIVGGLTLTLTALAVHLDVGVPIGDTTQIADIAKAATGDGAIYAAFQATSAVLLLSAASSSFAAGPGLLKALARTPGNALGILPEPLGRTNHHHTPYWAVLIFLGCSAGVVVGSAPPLPSRRQLPSSPSSWDSRSAFLDCRRPRILGPSARRRRRPSSSPRRRGRWWAAPRSGRGRSGRRCPIAIN